MAMVQPVDMAVKANEIMARFRPIAPKPVLPAAAAAGVTGGGDGAAAVAATNRVLCQLQSRPCRARKRGRPSVVPPVSPPAGAKRKRAPAYPVPVAPLRCAAVATATRARVSVVVVPAPGSAGGVSALAPVSPSAGDSTRLSPTVVEVEDEDEERGVVLVERDLLRKLLEPKVISPRAVRPVGSTIHVESVHIDVGRTTVAAAAAAPKTAEEVEAELESDSLPAVVSDSSNRVRLVNDAYKRMVGQPECPWLDAVATAASRRISVEVALVVSEPPAAAAALPETCKGFSCSAKIAWERDGKWSSVHAPCDVTRLQCESRDYVFAWRSRAAGDA
uniref:Zinc finger protein Sdr4 n=1 Tax=Oryza sativa subsp. japonica TaxID=39947 RepID=M9NJ68_ORYSJ|nr:zinc finger protein Sdr4 [Oryza sativa Japonica Group]